MNDSVLTSKNLSGKTAGSERPLRIAGDKTSYWDRLNERCSEFCSSILVKETRQALKSRQFILTYFVLLLCVGAWTVIGLTTGEVSYQIGPRLLTGFWVILGFPLALIIPFSAYRSMAKEFEDGTIQLMSITTMRPYQIVLGKFGSAVLQMLIYLSVLAPCIACTYLLRGISVSQVLFGLSICVGGSIFFTVLGLFLAGAVRSRGFGIGVSVLFVLGLGWAYIGWCALSEELTRSGNMANWFNEPEAELAIFFPVAFFGSFALMLLVVSASQISFAADNRSTPVRAMMLVQHVLFFAVVIAAMPTIPPSALDFEFPCVVTMFAGHYWLLMGFLMIGESSQLSRRVRRTLPRSFFARSFFSLLMPGSGRGFLFALANIWTTCIAISLCVAFAYQLVGAETWSANATRWGRAAGVPPAQLASLLNEKIIFSTVTTGIFVSWFLAIIYLLMRFIPDKRRRDWETGTGQIVSLIAGALLVAFVSIGSFVCHSYFSPYGSWYQEGSLWLTLNWYWVATTLVDTSSTAYGVPDNFLGVAIFALQACAVILIAMVIASRELLNQPIATPTRVSIDQAEQQVKSLPKGESLDEIFGELKPGNR